MPPDAATAQPTPESAQEPFRWAFRIEPAAFAHDPVQFLLALRWEIERVEAAAMAWYRTGQTVRQAERVA